jgi:hypothetical protein
METTLARESLQLLLLAAAAWLFLRSWVLYCAFRQVPAVDRRHNLLLIRGFRSSLIGLAFAGLAVASALHSTPILLLSIGIGGVETLESSALLFGLARGAAIHLDR